MLYFITQVLRLLSSVPCVSCLCYVFVVSFCISEHYFILLSSLPILSFYQFLDEKFRIFFFQKKKLEKSQNTKVGSPRSTPKT